MNARRLFARWVAHVRVTRRARTCTRVTACATVATVAMIAVSAISVVRVSASPFELSESSPDARGGTLRVGHGPIAKEFYAQWAREVEANTKALIAAGKLEVSKAAGTTRFGYPLRAATGRPEFGLWAASFFVDHAPAGGLLDYQCGARTYENDNGGHRGTDLSLTGVRWRMVGEEALHVVAAAPGTIIVRTDGQPDHNCVSLSDVNIVTTANQITIQHDDGTRAIYLHMKRDSITPKQIGDRVAEGEYLGVVASSGFSSGPHLHFEVRGTQNEVLDPWAGTCNATTQGLWKAQQPYVIKDILQIVPTAAPPQLTGLAYESISGHCASGVVAESEEATALQPKWTFKPGDPITILTFLRDMQKDDTTQMRVLDPAGHVVLSGTATKASSVHANFAFWFFERTLPADAAHGRYTIEVQYGGQTRAVPIEVSADPAPRIVRAFDFYAASLNHYFRVSNPAEAAAVRSGAAGDWVTTGEDVSVLAVGSAAPNVAPVCRFYGHPQIGPNSHFYTADADECAALKQLQARTPDGQPRWNYEEIAFSVHMPVQGICPHAAPLPIYRLYNNRAAQNDSNHRLTFRASAVAKMVAAGWTLENDGAPVMCAISRAY